MHFVNSITVVWKESSKHIAVVWKENSKHIALYFIYAQVREYLYISGNSSCCGTPHPTVPLDIHLLFSEVWEFLEQPVVVCSTPSHNTAHPPSSLYMSILLIAFGQVELLKWMLMLGLSPGILWCYDTSFQLVWSFWLRGWLFQISCLGLKKKKQRCVEINVRFWFVIRKPNQHIVLLAAE